MKLPFLHHETDVITDLRESNDILNNPNALRERITQDGYLLIRGLHEREAVLAARRQILEKLAEKGMLAPNTPLMDGVFNPEYPEPTSTGSMGNKALTQLSAFKAVVEGAPVMNFFRRFLGGDALTFDFKWLRTAGPGSASPIHYDIVFMGRGTQKPLLLLDTLRRRAVRTGPYRLLPRVEPIQQRSGNVWQSGCRHRPN